MTISLHLKGSIDKEHNDLIKTVKAQRLVAHDDLLLHAEMNILTMEVIDILLVSYITRGAIKSSKCRNR